MPVCFSFSFSFKSWPKPGHDFPDALGLPTFPEATLPLHPCVYLETSLLSLSYVPTPNSHQDLLLAWHVVFHSNANKMSLMQVNQWRIKKTKLKTQTQELRKHRWHTQYFLKAQNSNFFPMIREVYKKKMQLQESLRGEGGRTVGDRGQGHHEKMQNQLAQAPRRSLSLNWQSGTRMALT